MNINGKRRRKRKVSSVESICFSIKHIMEKFQPNLLSLKNLFPGDEDFGPHFEVFQKVQSQIFSIEEAPRDLDLIWLSDYRKIKILINFSKVWPLLLRFFFLFSYSKERMRMWIIEKQKHNSKIKCFLRFNLKQMQWMEANIRETARQKLPRIYKKL